MGEKIWTPAFTFALIRSLAALYIEVPLAADAADVAGGFQTLGQRDDLAGHHVEVLLNTELVLVLAGDESGAGRRTLRRGDVATLEAHAITRKLIHIRRADVLVHALRTEVGPAVVIGQDDDDVGLVGTEARAGQK